MTAAEAGGRITSAIVGFLIDDGWPVEQEGEVVRTGFSGDDGVWTCVAHASEQTEQLVFWSVFPTPISPSVAAEVALFCARANTKLAVGSFDFDPDEGEVRFRTGIDVEGAELVRPLVRQLVHANVLTMDRFFGRLATVAAGAEAAAVLEGSPDD